MWDIELFFSLSYFLMFVCFEEQSVQILFSGDKIYLFYLFWKLYWYSNSLIVFTGTTASMNSYIIPVIYLSHSSLLSVEHTKDIVDSFLGSGATGAIIIE